MQLDTTWIMLLFVGVAHGQDATRPSNSSCSVTNAEACMLARESQFQTMVTAYAQTDKITDEFRALCLTQVRHDEHGTCFEENTELCRNADIMELSLNWNNINFAIRSLCMQVCPNIMQIQSCKNKSDISGLKNSLFETFCSTFNMALRCAQSMLEDCQFGAKVFTDLLEPKILPYWKYICRSGCGNIDETVSVITRCAEYLKNVAKDQICLGHANFKKCVLGSPLVCDEVMLLVRFKYRVYDQMDLLCQTTTTSSTTEPPRTTENPRECDLSRQFKCYDEQKCIPLETVCDSQHDCVHGSDEQMCGARITLQDGNTDMSGRIGIDINGVHGSICSASWDDVNAGVLCRSLGYRAGRAVTNGMYGEGDGPIWFSDVQCTGKEYSIEDCPHTGPSSTNCTHAQDAGVICSSDSTKAFDYNLCISDKDIFRIAKYIEEDEISTSLVLEILRFESCLYNNSGDLEAVQETISSLSQDFVAVYQKVKQVGLNSLPGGPGCSSNLEDRDLKPANGCSGSSLGFISCTSGVGQEVLTCLSMRIFLLALMFQIASTLL